MSRVLSADWVLPVDGAPIENGAVAIEDGRISAVGPASKLGEGERFAGAAIVPGFVNAHTHLEYAVYAGFGDGLGDFAHTDLAHSGFAHSADPRAKVVRLSRNYGSHTGAPAGVPSLEEIHSSVPIPTVSLRARANPQLPA